jgi:hypothetical protein
LTGKLQISIVSRSKNSNNKRRVFMLHKQNKLADILKSTLAFSLIGAMLVAAGCGGSNSSTSGSSSTLSGVAATGNALAGVTVTVTDSHASSRTTTTDANGHYTLDVSGMTAPFAIVASGLAGDGIETLVSMIATQPAVGQTVIANITPLTNALVAAVDSTGDPLHLATNMVSEAANITAPKVVAATSNLQSALVNLLPQVGASTNPDFISGTLTTNGTGIDKLLDSLQIAVAPGGTTNGGTTISLKDGDGTVTTQALNLATAPTPLPVLNTVADYTVINAAQAALTACFAVTPAANRLTAAQCTGLVTADYLNNGKTAAQEFAFAALAGFDNAIAEPPQVIRFIDAQRALVKLVLDLSNGIHYPVITVAENSANTGNSWKLRGNQRHYFTFTTSVAEKRDELNANASLPSAYTSGINLYFDATAGDAAAVFANAGSYVKVTGPGLPFSGIILKPSLGTCAYLTITSETGNTAAAQKNTCGSYFRLTGIAQDPTKATTYATVFSNISANHNQNFSNGAVSDATLLTIHPFDAYTFTVHDANTNSDTAIIEWLRSRPLTTAELPYVHWNVLSPATKAALDPTNTSAFTGGASFPVSWIPQPLTAPVTVVNAQVRAGGPIVANNPGVSPLASSTSVTASVNFPSVTSMTFGTANKDFSLVQLNARNRMDLQIFSATSYTDY